MNAYKTAILYHNYYDIEGLNNLRERIKKLGTDNILLLTSITQQLLLENNIRNKENEKYIIATNKGKDIGGKLLLLDLILKLYKDIPYLMLLHDKKSLQKYSGRFEKEKLFEILEPHNYQKAINIFDTDSKVGIICQRECIRNEYDEKTQEFKTTNNSLLKELQNAYGIQPDNYSFVAGTMFWIRTSIIESFFEKQHPIKVRATLEAGNILDNENGTVTHSWERLLSWIASSLNYKIAGI